MEGGVKYSYRQWIDSYFNEFSGRITGFTTSDCRDYVKPHFSNFDDSKFLRALAGKLVDLDAEISDYSTDDLDDELKTEGLGKSNQCQGKEQN